MFKQYHWKVRWSCTTPFEERLHFSGSDEQNQKFEIQISSQCPVLGTIKQTGTMHTPYSLTAITSSLKRIANDQLESNKPVETKRHRAENNLKKTATVFFFLLPWRRVRTSYTVQYSKYTPRNMISLVESLHRLACLRQMRTAMLFSCYLLFAICKKRQYDSEKFSTTDVRIQTPDVTSSFSTSSHLTNIKLFRPWSTYRHIHTNNVLRAPR